MKLKIKLGEHEIDIDGDFTPVIGQSLVIAALHEWFKAAVPAGTAGDGRALKDIAAKIDAATASIDQAGKQLNDTGKQS